MSTPFSHIDPDDLNRLYSLSTDKLLAIFGQAYTDYMDGNWMQLDAYHTGELLRVLHMIKAEVKTRLEY